MAKTLHTILGTPPMEGLTTNRSPTPRSHPLVTDGDGDAQDAKSRRDNVPVDQLQFLHNLGGPSGETFVAFHPTASHLIATLHNECALLLRVAEGRSLPLASSLCLLSRTRDIHHSKSKNTRRGCNQSFLSFLPTFRYTWDHRRVTE